MRGGWTGTCAGEFRKIAEDLGAARAGTEGIVGRGREGDVVRAAINPVWTKLCFLLEGRNRGLEPAQGVAHPDEAPIRWREDLGRSLRRKDFAYRTVPSRTSKLRRNAVFFLWR